MTSREIPKWLLLLCLALGAAGSASAQEPAATPSEKMKEAVGKLNKAPASIGQSLQGLRDAAAAKLKQTLGGGGVKTETKTEAVDLAVPQKTAETVAPAHVMKEGSRDPFRPMTLKTKVNIRARENLSPLERYDLGQLKIVGIIWDIKEPRAMIEDTAGLGYTVKIGTPIGANDGRVKAIRRDQIVVEEVYEDAYGARKKRDVSMKLSTE